MMSLTENANGTASPVVFVAMANPTLRGYRSLVPALRHEVEVMVAGVHHVDAARIAGIGVEDGALRVAIKHADARQIGRRYLLPAVIVIDLAGRQLFRPERGAVIVTELAVHGRKPLERP